jgi:four helix bundle protein
MSRIERARELQDRTKKFALRIISAFSRLPKTEAARVIGKQFLRSGTSVAANYRAACRARSAADFISKISVIVEEADETPFWVELIVEANLVPAKVVEALVVECEKLLKIFSALLATAKANRQFTQSLIR